MSSRCHIVAVMCRIGNVPYGYLRYRVTFSEHSQYRDTLSCRQTVVYSRWGSNMYSMVGHTDDAAKTNGRVLHCRIYLQHCNITCNYSRYRGTLSLHKNTLWRCRDGLIGYRATHPGYGVTYTRYRRHSHGPVLCCHGKLHIHGKVVPDNVLPYREYVLLYREYVLLYRGIASVLEICCTAP